MAEIRHPAFPRLGEAIRFPARDAFLLALLVASLWMRQAFPVFGLGFAGFDDMLFVRMGASLSQGHWLGRYDNLTLAKGMGFPALIALDYPLGIPLKSMEQALYLGASLWFALVFARLVNSRWIAVLVFAVLAFNPVMWAPEAGGRVARENLYVSLSLALIAAALRSYARPLDEPGEHSPAFRPGSLFAFGTMGGWFWLTREEGLWLVPAIAIPVAAWAAHWLRRRDSASRDLPALARHVAFPLLGFWAVVGLVDGVNFVNYGVFRNNDFRSDDFQAAYGALSRISHDHWRRYVVFPKDARERAYRVSPAARELRPYFEGQGAADWARTGCDRTGKFQCRDEILSGWFMWALRDAVAYAGHYTDARESRRYYRTLADQIDRACSRHEIPCGPPHHTLVPPWHREYLRWTVDATLDIAKTLSMLGGMTIRARPSLGKPGDLALMTRMINSPVSMSDRLPENARTRIALYVTELQRLNLQYVLPASLLLWLAALVIRPGSMPGGANVALLSLLAAVAARVALLGFLDATSLPSNNLLYLSPAVPEALVAGPCALAIVMSAFFRGKRRESAAPAGSRRA
jgi:hypothetical protein